MDLRDAQPIDCFQHIMDNHALGSAMKLQLLTPALGGQDKS